MKSWIKVILINLAVLVVLFEGLGVVGNLFGLRHQPDYFKNTLGK